MKWIPAVVALVVVLAHLIKWLWPSAVVTVDINYVSGWKPWWAWHPVHLHTSKQRAWCRWVMRRWAVYGKSFDIVWQYEEPLVAMIYPEGVPDENHNLKRHSP
jgi:hypothetical protein